MNIHASRGLFRAVTLLAALCATGFSSLFAQVSLHGIYAEAPQSGVTALFAVHDNNTTGIYIFDTNQQRVGAVEAAIAANGGFSASALIGYNVTGQLSTPAGGGTPSITGTLVNGGTTISLNVPRTALFGPGNGVSFEGRFEGVARKPGQLLRTTVVFFIDANLNLYFVHRQADGSLTGGTGSVVPNASNNGGTFSATDVTGLPISGSFTSTTLVMTGTVTTPTGTYDFEATRVHALNRLGNISTRGFVGTGQDVLIGGFVLYGGPKLVLIRVLGPSLTAFGVTDALAVPTLTLYSGSRVLLANTGWKTAANANDIRLSPYPPNSDGDCAILTVLEPGPYTTIVSGANNTTGVALVEVYEVLLD